MNEETIYVLKLVVSMIPVAIVGFTMKDWVESLFVADMAYYRIILTCHGTVSGRKSFCEERE